MSHTRAILRLLAFAVLTGVLFSGYLVTRLGGLLSRRFARSSHFWFVGNWARGCMRILGATIEIEGSAPRGAFFLVSNHLSYVDVIVLLTQLEGVLLARSDVARWPIFGLLARSTGTLFVDRARRADLPRVIAEVERTLERNMGVVVFPEGTSSEGAEVKRFKPGLFEVAVRTRTPVSCATLSYETDPRHPPAHLSVCWWGDMTFPGHFYRLFGLPGFRARVSFGDEPIVATDRKVLAVEAQRAVAARFVPVVA